MKNRCLAAVFCMSVAAAAQAAPMRTELTRENMILEKTQFEAGLVGEGRDASGDEFAQTYGLSATTIMPYARYGLTKELTLNAGIPVKTVSPEGLSDSTGLGDLQLGFDVVVYQDTLGYPYLMPYANIGLPTGDEDKGLGAGQLTATMGAVIGTTVCDDYHWAVDIGYTVAQDKNGVNIGGSFIWDLSKKCSVLAEVLRNDANLSADIGDRTFITNAKTLGLGGVIYRPTDAWMVGVYAGGSLEGDGESIVAAKICRTFDRLFE